MQIIIGKRENQEKKNEEIVKIQKKEELIGVTEKSKTTIQYNGVTFNRKRLTARTYYPYKKQIEYNIIKDKDGKYHRV